MAKFKIVKKMSLDFLGEDWSDAYLELTPITTKEFQEEDFASLATIDRENNEEVQQALKKSLEILKRHLVGGKGVDMDGEEIEIEKDDIVDLPAEVLIKSLNFLSQSSAEVERQPSTKS